MTETGLVLILIYLIIFKHRNLNIAVIIYRKSISGTFLFYLMSQEFKKTLQR